MPQVRRIVFALFIFLLSGISSASILTNKNNISIDELCVTNCVCDSKNRDCSNSPVALSLRFFSKSVNSSTELFSMNRCDSGGLFNFDWLENASSELRRLIINDCGLERVIVRNVSVLSKFDQLDEIDLSNNGINHLPIDALGSFLVNLTKFNLRKNALKYSYNFTNLIRLENFDLSHNRLTEIPELPAALRYLNVSHNLIGAVRANDFDALDELEILDLSYCRIGTVDENAFSQLLKLKFLRLDGNAIGHLPSTIFSGLSQIRTIDLSQNQLTEFDAGSLLRESTELRSLILDDNPIRRVARFPTGPVHLSQLSIAGTELVSFDFFVLSALPNLRNLILRDNRLLRTCDGALAAQTPSLRRLDVSNGGLTQLRTNFFENVTSLEEINLIGNPWACDCRLRQWSDRLMSQPHLRLVGLENLTSICPDRNRSNGGDLYNATSGENTESCDIGTAIASSTIERTTYDSDLILDCGAFGDPSPTVKWTHMLTNQILGQWPPRDDGSADIDRSWENEKEKYTVLPGGLLLVRKATGYEVGPYRCTVYNRHGNASSIIFLRLNYSNWWEMKLYSVACGIITAIGFFILNVIYAAIRRLVMWRISKLEQTSRVRLLLEAMEKYRRHQMENLHDKYTSKMNQIRENYHGQVDQMRRGYEAQAGRFRDYRVAQMEYMSHHIDSIRDNYNWQANRVREYGSRQMERLWESYQRQVNRLRAFSLQQRLRLMHQYKIKQRYWNKIYESVNIETGGPQKNGHIRVAIHPEMIELPDLPADDVDEDMSRPGPSGRNNRTSMIDEFDDTVSALIMNKTLKESEEDLDGSSYHSATGEELEPLEAEILSQIDADTEAALNEHCQIPPIITSKR